VARENARYYIDAYEKLGYHGLNVGAEELSAGFEFIIELSKNMKVEFLSANIFNLQKGKLLFKPYTIFKRDGLKIGIIGLISSSDIQSPDYEIKDYISAGNKYLSELEEMTDIQVILVNAPREEFKRIQKEFILADYIFTSGGLLQTRGNVAQKAGEPLLYSHQKQGKYVSDIHLTLIDRSKDIIDASGYKGRMAQLNRQLSRFQAKDSTKTFQELYKNSPNLLKMIEGYVVEVAEGEKFVADAVNSNEFKAVPMDSKIKDDPEFFKMITQVLNKTNP